MTRKTAADFDPAVLSLFDKYVHGRIDRRGFLDGAAHVRHRWPHCGGPARSAQPELAEAQQVAKDDAHFKASLCRLSVPEGNDKVHGYLVQPAKVTGKLPTVLVVHENRGLNPHIEDIARRLALDNFIAFAPDALVSPGRLSR